MMKKIIMVLGFLILLVGCEKESSEVIGNFNISRDLTINFTTKSSNPNCTDLTGNYITKTLTIGEEEVEGVLDNAIQMTSYEGDFRKLNSSNTETEVTKARFIASNEFKNRSLCSKVFMGVSVRTNPEYRWYNTKRGFIFKPLVAYYCAKKHDNLRLCK